MQFTREIPPNVNVIRAHSERAIRIGERELVASFLVSATQLIENWRPRTVAALQPADFDALLAWQPEIVLLGTGVRQQFPVRGVHAAMLSRQIGFEAMDTGAACRTFNVLVSENRRVAMAVIL